MRSANTLAVTHLSEGVHFSFGFPQHRFFCMLDRTLSMFSYGPYAILPCISYFAHGAVDDLIFG